MNIPVLRGRDFNAQDREGAPGVIIINETFARRYFPDQDPLGKRLSLSGARGPWLEVVGLARDGKYVTLGETSAPMIYQSILQRHETGMTLLIRGRGDSSSLAAAVRREVQAVEENLPVANIRPMTSCSTNRCSRRGWCGAARRVRFAALLLAAVGLYG